MTPLRDAESATAGVPVVRGLEWTERSSVPDGAWSETMLAQRRGHHNLGRYAGSYSVQELMPGGKWGWWNSWTSDHHPEGVEDTEEAAQAACQADYEQRITSALNPDFLSELDTARAEIDRLRRLIREDPKTILIAYEDGAHMRASRAAATLAEKVETAESALTAAQARIAEMERLEKLVRVFLDNNPDEAVADSGETVLDLFRYQARTTLSAMKENDRG